MPKGVVIYLINHRCKIMIQASLNNELASGGLIDFASVASQIAATSKRTQKAAILGTYFTGLSDSDLVLAARYFSGYIFPLKDQRNVNIGAAALLTAIAAVSGEEKAALQAKIVKLGDPGDVAAAALKNQDIQPSLTLDKFSQTLEKLAESRGNKLKNEFIINLLKQSTALEAKYIVKLLAGDLRIGLKEGAVEDAIARLYKTQVSRVQWTNMLLGDIGETALLARRGELERAQMQLFHPLKFMLASPVNDLTEVTKQLPSGFAVEDKFDGIRAQVHIGEWVIGNGELDNQIHGSIVNNKRIALFSRTLDEITRSFPDLIEPLAAIQATDSPILDFRLPILDDLEVQNHRSFKHGDNQKSKIPNLKSVDVILDGEIVPIRGDKILPFQELQKRLGRKTVSDELLVSVPVVFIAYDILYAGGKVLINEPFTARRKVLESLELNHPRVRRADSKILADISQIDAEFIAAKARGNEGLMVKDPASTYKPGRRGKEWLKIKRAIATLDVVITAAEVGSGKRHRFLSDYTFAVRKSETDPTLLNIGKAYSGLTDAEIAELSDWCRAHTLQELAHGKVCLVEPQIVLEITCDRIQPSSRHNSGYALRFPRILRIRNDKPVTEIDTLETVISLAENSSAEFDKSEPEFVDNTVGSAESETTIKLPIGIATPNLEAAEDAFKAFVNQCDRTSSITILHDSDADGVTAGIILQLALERAKFERVTRVVPDRDRNPWTATNRAKVIATKPDYLFVLDLGSREQPVIENISTCSIDHHRPEGFPPGDTLISAYSWQPIPNTSLLVWELCKQIANVDDLNWIAAIGTISDLGEKAPFEMLAVAKSQYTAKYLKEATTLINAARRASNYNPEIAAKALLTHLDPRSLVNSNTPEVEQLKAARKEVQAAVEEGKKAAPVFAGNVALVRVNSACQIHPLIAQIWRTRLPKYVVIVANEGYIPGKVNFSVRTASDTNILDLLRSIELSEKPESYGHGHDSASGGSLPIEQWQEFLQKLGFNN